MRTYIIFAVVLISTVSPAQPTIFESRGVGGGGALFANSFNPFDKNELYVACDMSQVFHTTDLGTQWRFPDFRQLQSYKIAKVAFTAGGTIRYAIDGSSTEDGSDRSRPVRSTDGGVTWNPLASDPTSGGAYMIFAHPQNENIVLISDYSTLYGSTNGGASFSQKYKTSNNSAGLHIAGVFFDGNDIYVGTNEGIYSSTNGGGTFSKMNITGIPSGEYILSFCGGKSNGSIRFYCVTNSSVWAGIDPIGNFMGFKGIYTMTSSQTTWTNVSSSIPNSSYPYFIAMASNTTDVAYTAGGSSANAPIIYKTTNAGGSWQSVFKTTNNENIATGWSGDGGDRLWSYGEYALGFDVAPSDANYCSISDLGFVHTTTDGGMTWKQKYVTSATENPVGQKTPTRKPYQGVGIENTTCWQIFWVSKFSMLGCFSDIRGVRTVDYGKSWSFDYSGHTDNSMYRIVKNTANNTLYAATSTVHDLYQSTYLTDARIDNGKGKVLYSTSNGSSWTVLHDFAHPVIWLAADPLNPNRLYASVVHSSQGGIYVSNNIDQGAGSTWTKLTNPPRTEGHPFNINVLNDGSLVVSYSGRRTSNFTASSGVFYSTDGGTTWVDRSDPNMQYWTKDVVIDPHDAAQNTWYAGVFSGWGGAANNKGGLYKTTNRGQSWTKVHSNMRVTSCTFHPTNPNVMYFTTETSGLFYSENRRDASPSFTQVTNYPFRQPERVFFNPYDSNEVWVSSFGSGMMVGLTKPIEIIPEKVTLLLPNNGDTIQAGKMNFSWNAAVNATSYQLQMALDSLFTSPTSENTNFTFWNQISTVPSNTYYWRVRGTNKTSTGEWSDIWKFTTVSAIPPPPEITYPKNNSEGIPVSMTIRWNSTAFSDAYHLRLSTTQDFSTVEIDTIIEINNFCAVSNLTKGTRYYLSVQGKNSSKEGNPSVISFLTAGVVIVPGRIILITPEDSAIIKVKYGGTYIQSVEFDWQIGDLATAYHVQISSDSLFTTIAAEDSTLSTTQYLFTVPDTTESYWWWWRVRAKNMNGWGEWSDQRSVYIIPESYYSVKEDLYSIESVQVYPNPSSGNVLLTFSLQKTADINIRLFNIIGKEVYQHSLNHQSLGEHTERVTLPELAAGVYYLQLRTDTHRKTIPVIIQ